MRVFDGFDGIKSAVGIEIGSSDWIEITQQRINLFAEATCDEQWIHVDQGRAEKELPGGRTIAHGLLSLSLAPMFVRSVMGLKGLKNTLNYGADRVRFISPVPAGSRVRGRITIAKAEDVPPAARELPHGDRNRRQSTPRLRRRPCRPALSLMREPLIGAGMHVINR